MAREAPWEAALRMYVEAVEKFAAGERGTGWSWMRATR